MVKGNDFDRHSLLSIRSVTLFRSVLDNGPLFVIRYVLRACGLTRHICLCGVSAVVGDLGLTLKKYYRDALLYQQIFSLIFLPCLVKGKDKYKASTGLDMP